MFYLYKYSIPGVELTYSCSEENYDRAMTIAKDLSETQHKVFQVQDRNGSIVAVNITCKSSISDIEFTCSKENYDTALAISKELETKLLKVSMQNKEKLYREYVDAQHGWIAVKRKELMDLGILNSISRFSYQRGATVYLEEDCDVGKFVEAYKNAHGVEPKFSSPCYSKYSRIRSYDSFKC